DRAVAVRDGGDEAGDLRAAPARVRGPPPARRRDRAAGVPLARQRLVGTAGALRLRALARVGRPQARDSPPRLGPGLPAAARARQGGPLPAERQEQLG